MKINNSISVTKITWSIIFGIILLPICYWVYSKSQLISTMKPGQVWERQLSNNTSDPFKRETITYYRLILDKKEGFVQYIESDKPTFDISEFYINTYSQSCRAIFFTIDSKLYNKCDSCLEK